MDDHSLLMVVTSLIGALGLKEIWAIVKQKIDINAKKDEREDNFILDKLKNLRLRLVNLKKRLKSLLKKILH